MDTVFDLVDDDLLASTDDAVLPTTSARASEQMKAQVVDGRIVYLSKALPDADIDLAASIAHRRFAAAVPACPMLDTVLAAGDLTGYFEVTLNVAIGDYLPASSAAWLPTAAARGLEIDFEVISSWLPLSSPAAPPRWTGRCS